MGKDSVSVLHDPGSIRMRQAKNLHATRGGDRQGVCKLEDFICESCLVSLCDTVLSFFYLVANPTNRARTSSSSIFSLTIGNQASLYIYAASLRSLMHSLSAAIDAMAGRPPFTSLRLTCSRMTLYSC